MTMPRRLIVLLVSCLPSLILLANYIRWTTGEIHHLDQWRRYGEDMSVATTDYLEHIEPTGRPSVTLSDEAAKTYMRGLQNYIRKMVLMQDIRPWQFWRTLRRDPPARPGHVVHRMNDDVGRAWLTAQGFRHLGGVSPFLLFWLTVFMCVPVLIWVVWEFAVADHLLAGFLFAVLFASSPFFVESMATPYVAIGFHFIALLGAVALGVSMILGNHLSYGSFALRACFMGAILAICALCRNGTLTLLPGILLSMTLGARRLRIDRRRPADNSIAIIDKRDLRLVALFILGVILLVGPYLVVRPAKQHEIWLGVWQGLGDFDRTKGYVWADHVALAAFLDAGFDRDVPREVQVYERNMGAPEREAFFRDQVLASVRSDPLWYLRILAQRLYAVVTQIKLYQLGAQKDPATTPPLAPNEGKIGFHYSRVTTADWMGFAAFRVVVPLPVVWCVGLVFLSFFIWCRHKPRSRAVLWLSTCVSLAILTMPVLITTAGAFEAQAFILVYMLACAIIIERLLCFVWSTSIVFLKKHGQRDGQSLRTSSIASRHL
ncbi:MAG: hypothetical protein JXO72_15720 [Vicinamibacteria bacterium]|nr:hypothetical protein [Vicinamibacteria bacterium]